MVEHFIGRHRIRFEPPDLVFVINDGEISRDQATELIGRVQVFAEGKDRVFLMFDLERSGHIEPAARKIVVDSFGRMRVGGIAMFGASFTHRVIASLMMKATGIFFSSPLDVHFFASEADARAWIDERRRG